MRHCKLGIAFLSVILLNGLVASPFVFGAEPQYGGVLRVALAGDPPSLDMHQEQTFKVAIPMSTVYNSLVTFDPHAYPKVIGDLAKSWETSADGLVWTFQLHQGVQFHDGSELTAADVKASWDKIVFPPKGVASTRRSLYQMIKGIDASERYTVVFRTHYPSASFLPMIAHPANFIYAKKYLDEDVHWYKKNTMGTGPFTLKKWVRGSSLEVARNPNYFKKGLPYMDGIKYFMIKDLSARAKSIRSGRTDVEFRGLPPAEVEAMKAQMGDKITVAYPGQPVHWGVSINIEKKPFDDERVRKALSLAINRYDMAKTLDPLSGLNTVGGPQPPGSFGALSAEELQALPGFAKDHGANLKEAKRLLTEAGYPDGFKTVLTNRSVKLPYIDLGVYIVSAWKKIGVEAEHKLEESATWSKTRRTRDFELVIDPFGYAAGADPDEILVKFLTGSSGNWGRFSDPEIDKLFEQQKVERDEQKRTQLVKDLQRRVIDHAWEIMGLWWTRIEVRSAHIQNYDPHPSHWQNRRLEDVWLAKK